MLQMLFIVLACIIACVGAGSVNLTNSELVSEIGAHRTMVVMYYAPWCSYSKELLPIWEELADSMAKSSQDKDILVAKVDCVAEPDAYWRENIKSFPTIKAYVNHNIITLTYDGERIANTMWRYFRLLHQQYVTEIGTVAEFGELQESKLSKTKPLVLALLAPEDGYDDANKRTSKVDGACKKADRVHCVISRSPALAASLQLPVPSVTVFTMFDSEDPASEQQVEVYANERYSIDKPTTRTDIDATASEDLAAWITNRSYPPLVQLTAENSNLIFSQQRSGFENHFLFLVHDVDSVQGRATLDTLRQVGRNTLGQAVLIYIDMTNLSSYAADVLRSLDVAVPSERHPDVTVALPVDSVRAVLSKSSTLKFFAGLSEDGDLRDADKVQAWVSGVLQGAVTPLRTSSFDTK